MTQTAQLNAKAIRATHIQQAFDLIHSYYDGNHDLIPDGNNVVDYSISLLQGKLTNIGYGLANNTPQIVSAYLARRGASGKAPFAANDAEEPALQLYTLVTGRTADPNQAAATAPAVNQNKSEQDTQETGATNGALPVSGADASDADNATDIASETEIAEMNNAVATKPASATPVATRTASPAAQQFRGSFVDVDFDQESIDSINTILQQATGGRAKSILALVESVHEAELAVFEQAKAIASGTAKRDALKAGDMDLADKIEFGPVPLYKPSGLSTLKGEGPNAVVLGTLLSAATARKITSLDQVVAALAEAEKLAADNSTQLRQIVRDVRSLSPKEKQKVSAHEEAEDLDCTIVMRMASDIFKDAFGHSAPILDFEIATLEWNEKHPDVPEVDQSFRFFAPVLADALDSMVHGEICWIYGESGCGKSEFWSQLAARIGYPVFRLNMDSHLTRGDIVGSNRLVAGPNGNPIMVFVEGLVPRALKIPSVLLIDEMDLGDPEIMPVLQPVLEGKGIRLLEDAGRYVRPHELSRIAVTANTIGLGSANQMYLNAHEQSAATRDRIAKFIEMPYLPADKELEVVMLRVPEADQAFAEKVIQLANKVREGYRQGSIHQVFSTRTVLRAVRRHAKFAPLYNDDEKAVLSTLEITVLNRCDATSHQVVKNLVDNIF